MFRVPYSVSIFFLEATCFVVLKEDSKVVGGLYLKAVLFYFLDFEVAAETPS